jgi:hypothetical protein
MSRKVSSCTLSTWLDANPRGSESRVTSILAAALVASPPLACRLLSRLGVDHEGEVLIDLEVPTGANRNRIDLELRAVDKSQRLVGRAWIEVKTGTWLAAEQAGSSTTAARQSQLVRYRTALDARDSIRHVARSPLAVLLPRVGEKHERAQIRETGAVVLLWRTMAEMAAARAHEIGGQAWRVAARKPEASLELANIETLIWLLERGTNEKGDRYMGLNVNDPLDDELLSVYSNAGRAVAAVEAFLEGLSMTLEERAWTVTEDDDEDEDEDEDDRDVARIDGFVVEPPGDSWWSGTSGGLTVTVCPVDIREDPPPRIPVLRFALDFESDDVPQLSPEWLERLQSAGFVAYEDPDSGQVASVEAVVALREVLSGGQIATDQGSAAADWIEIRLASLRSAPQVA